MIFGAHVIVYSKDAPADRAFFRDVLGFNSVDAGHGSLIFALPPSEVVLHPCGEKWSARTLLLVRQPEIGNGSANKKGSHVLCGSRRKMGFHYEDTASGWRRDGSLSTKAPDSPGPRLKVEPPRKQKTAKFQSDLRANSSRSRAPTRGSS